MMSDDNDTKPTAEPLSAGFVLVDVVLTAHQAFIVRKWDEAAKFKITAAKAEQAKMGINARNEVEDFRPGVRCKIVSVHHSCFSSDVGKVIIVTKVSADSRQVWAHDDKPVTYKINRTGRRVVDSDPHCIQSIYGMDSLRVLE
jgi:hypothetical protein